MRREQQSLIMGGPWAAQVERFRTDLLRLLDGPPRLGVAVSGGADSLALLILANAAFPDAVEAATVDHGLRPESIEEASFVAQVCANLNVPHATLRPEEPIEGNVQAWARAARYRLLEAWRQERDLDAVATAHHCDDQAETLLMRLNRGSGLAGLSAVRSANRRVLRPLLGWRRFELEAIVAAADIEPVADPSNSDERFDRARIRRQMRDAAWIDPVGLGRSAGALAEAEGALGWATERLVEERIRGDGRGVELDPREVPPELRRRLLLAALRRISRDAAPRGHEISRLMETLQNGGTATLAGVRCSGGQTWRLAPAPPRRSG